MDHWPHAHMQGSFSAPTEGNKEGDVVSTPAAEPGPPPEAWQSPPDDQAPDTYQINLSKTSHLYTY